MTDQEIEKLKNLCEKEGFELDFISQSTQGAMDIFRVSKKDVPVRVNVSSIRYSREPIIEYMGELISSETIDCTVHFTIEGSSPKIILKDDFRQLLSKCLEDYLNKS